MIPESVRTRPDKMGFPTPARRWFAGALYESVQDALASREVRERGIYDTARIRRDLERHRAGEVDVADGLFNVIQLERWFGMQRAERPHEWAAARGSAGLTTSSTAGRRSADGLATAPHRG